MGSCGKINTTCYIQYFCFTAVDLCWRYQESGDVARGMGWGMIERNAVSTQLPSPLRRSRQIKRGDVF